MNPTLRKFEALSTWKRGHQRAPHKPLLVLLALARWQQGRRSALAFEEIASDLTALLSEFGHQRKSHHPEYPFWRLCNDGVWIVKSDQPMRRLSSNDDALKSELLAKHATGRFAPEVEGALQEAPALVAQIASRMLEMHFPESLHPDILERVGLSLTASAPRPRDSKFRERVLTAYERRCAVCGFDVRLGSVSIALDAAHIRWHQAQGPDEESNGLALCVLHHKTFDIGAFTISREGRLLVSDLAFGHEGFEAGLMRHHSLPIRAPQRPEWRPHPDHLRWHTKEVFKGMPRCTSS